MPVTSPSFYTSPGGHGYRMSLSVLLNSDEYEEDKDDEEVLFMEVEFNSGKYMYPDKDVDDKVSDDDYTVDTDEEDSESYYDDTDEEGFEDEETSSEDLKAYIEPTAPIEAAKTPRTHIEAHINVEKGGNDDSLKWPFVGDVTITLLNQLEDKNHYSEVVSFTAEDNMQVGDSWVLAEFIPHSKLSRKYLKDKTLCISGCRLKWLTTRLGWSAQCNNESGS